MQWMNTDIILQLASAPTLCHFLIIVGKNIGVIVLIEVGSLGSDTHSLEMFEAFGGIFDC